MRFQATGVIAALTIVAAAPPDLSQPEGPAMRGAAIFAERCKDCHEQGDDRAPPRAALATRTVEDIVAALTTGPMAPVAEGLTPEDKRAVAAFLTGH